MKSLFRFLITAILTFKAKRTLKKNGTQVIAVTGSVGKTSTKEAIYTVLKDHFDVYAHKKGFNTDIGLSLAILQEESSGFSSPLAWLKILKRVFFNSKPAHQKIVLEMGADHPGDLKKLIKIAPPAISVVTNVNPVHLEEGQFSSIEAIAREKETLVKHLPRHAMAVLNHDDKRVNAMKTEARKIMFGMTSEAEIYASEVHATSKELRFKVTHKGQTEEFKVPVLGEFQIYVLLPAIAIGLQMGISLAGCAKALAHFSTPPGRMNPIQGLNRSHIIDSSYNASPVTMQKSLEMLGGFKSGRKIVALGTMNELGDSTKEAHLKIGSEAAKVADILLAVGFEAPALKQGALAAGMAEEKVYTFFNSEDAGEFLKEQLQPRDLVLVKGSQNKVRMEKLVKIVMSTPNKAGELLCRQGEMWERI